jgi:RmlD substrate binding domain
MILLTGASGQLGEALARRLEARRAAYTAVTRPQFDFEKPQTVQASFAQTRPGLVINAAAYTAVDKAETEPDAAQAGNYTGPLLLAQLCAQAEIPLIHVSTDYVFDGLKGAPYLETDPTNPAGIYGATKRDGETAILATEARAIVLRTAWVYSATGKNFARTMLTAGRKSPSRRPGGRHPGDHGQNHPYRLAPGISRHFPRRRRRGDNLARLCHGDFPSSRQTGLRTTGGPADRHRRLADPGAAPGGFPAGLRQAHRSLRPPSAGLARKPARCRQRIAEERGLSIRNT